MKSYIVQLWQRIFGFLRWVSVFQILMKVFLKKTRSHVFVDSWVLFNLVLSLLSIFIVRYVVWRWVVWCFIVWGILRIFEIVIYQINVLFFDPYETKTEIEEYSLGGYRRIIILSLHNYLEIILWFASFYFKLHVFFCDPNEVLNSWQGSIYFSVVTITTLGYGDVTPFSSWTRFLVISQTLIGIFFIAIIVARFISYLPKPKTLDEKENR